MKRWWQYGSRTRTGSTSAAITLKDAGGTRDGQIFPNPRILGSNNKLAELRVPSKSISNMYEQLGQRIPLVPEKKAGKNKSEHFVLTMRLHCESLECFMDDTRLSLSQSMREMDSEGTEDDFKSLTKDLYSLGVTGEHLLKEHEKAIGLEHDVAEAEDSRWRRWGNFTYALISLAYLVDAEKALEKKNRDEAWVKIAQSRFYCGVAAMAAQIPSVISARKKITGRKNGLKSSDSQFRELREEAIRYVRETAPERGKWTRHGAAKLAVRYLTEYVQTHKKKDGSNFRTLSTGKSGISTVAGWFKEMPEAQDLFEPR